MFFKKKVGCLKEMKIIVLPSALDSSLGKWLKGAEGSRTARRKSWKELYFAAQCFWPLAEKRAEASISRCDISNEKANLLYYLQGGKGQSAPGGTTSWKAGKWMGSSSSWNDECFFVPLGFCIRWIADSRFLFPWYEYEPDPDLTQASSSMAYFVWACGLSIPAWLKRCLCCEKFSFLFGSNNSFLVVQN